MRTFIHFIILAATIGSGFLCSANPQDGMRQLTPVQLEHMVLAHLADEIGVNSEDTILLSDPACILNGIPEAMNMTSPFSSSDVKTAIVPSNNGSIFIWELPDPSELTECKYIAFVPCDKNYKMYGIEKTFDPDLFDNNNDDDDEEEEDDDDSENAWILGSTSSKGHANFGSVKCPKSPEQFVELLKSKGLLFNNKEQ